MTHPLDAIAQLLDRHVYELSKFSPDFANRVAAEAQQHFARAKGHIEALEKRIEKMEAETENAKQPAKQRSKCSHPNKASQPT